jgi:hypothetical protein
MVDGILYVCKEEGSLMFRADGGDEETESGELDDLSEEGSLESSAEAACPYCGERITIPLDPSGGRTQEYVEDCQVCCQPCHVHVTYDENGVAEVSLEEAQ